MGLVCPVCPFIPFWEIQFLADCGRDVRGPNVLGLADWLGGEKSLDKDLERIPALLLGFEGRDAGLELGKVAQLPEQAGCEVALGFGVGGGHARILPDGAQRKNMPRESASLVTDNRLL